MTSLHQNYKGADVCGAETLRLDCPPLLPDGINQSHSQSSHREKTADLRNIETRTPCTRSNDRHEVGVVALISTATLPTLLIARFEDGRRAEGPSTKNAAILVLKRQELTSCVFVRAWAQKEEETTTMMLHFLADAREGEDGTTVVEAEPG